ncbi:MAG: 4Fe-4S binding protein [Candidatus Bipolaricaulota bacterium]|nr:MAG: 4Fe-4S binding protein [Candidatus Bipolaricaulota bacterium]
MSKRDPSRNAARRRVAQRRAVQWLLLGIVVVTIGVGWRIPWFGFSVPLVMLVGIIGSFFRGRFVCGNLCPRGAFYDRLVAKVSRSRPVPRWLRSLAFRWGLVVVLMGFMIYRIALNPADPLHWGRVFWLMCVVTTAIGLPLGVLIHPRSWCSFCPIGTIQRAVGGRKNPLRIEAERCRACALCEQHCPMGLTIVEHRHRGTLPHADCLRCSECVAACPAGALRWPAEQRSV